MRDRRSLPLRALRSVSLCLALGTVALLAANGQVLAQSSGATDTATEGQVKPQIIQNPTIPSIPDPEPSFATAKKDAVLVRPRPEYGAIGLEAGGIISDITWLGRGQPFESFLLFPKVDVGLTFDDNVFADGNAQVVDFVGSVKPSLKLISNWDNHEFFVEARGRFTRNLLEGRESVREHGFSVGGKLEISEFEFLRLTAAFDRKTTPRGDPIQDVGGDEPGVHYDTSLDGVWEYQRDKFLWRAKAGIKRFDFVDVPAGAGVIEADRNDRIEMVASARVGYEAWDGTTLFFEPGIKTAIYRLQFDNSGVERDFVSIFAKAGFTYDLTAVTFLEGAIGAGHLILDDANARNLTFFDASLDLVWNPHDSWTFTAGLSRDVVGTTATTAVGNNLIPDIAVISTTMSLGAQLEVTYELLAAMQTSLKRSSAVSGGTDDNTIANELSLLWLMNEHMRLRTFWEMTKLFSSDTTRQFLRNRIGVVLTLHY